MANTTFNGPVRSENGFQEWDGSAWVPVGGGGGTTTVFPVADGVANTVTAPAPTAVGQQYTYASEIISGGASAGTTLEFTTAVTPLYDTAVVQFVYSRRSTSSVGSAGTGSPANLQGSNFCYATFSYIGTAVSGGVTYGIFFGTLAA